MNELFASPAAGFDDPFEMLVQCHRRVQHFAGLVVRISERLTGHPQGPDVAQAAGSVLRYFDTAGRNHHRDEEDDLFPALLAAAAGRGSGGAQALIDRLQEDHRRLDALWANVRFRLEVLRDGGVASLPVDLARDFSDAYADHIAEEESLLLPLARHLLDADAIVRLGASMAARRGVGKTGSGYFSDGKAT